MRPKPAISPTDVAIARLAARQHGVVSLGQLAEAGMSRRAASHRVKAGRLHRVHRGVYAVGHAGLGNEGRWLAAVLACGEGAALSHRSAAALWSLLPATRGVIDVTVPGGGGRARRPGIRIHRSLSLTSALTTQHKGIAVTVPARTLSDLRRVAPPQELNTAIRQAEVFGLDVGDQDRGPGLTRSELERRFLGLCRRHRLPRPEVNARVGPYEVDFLFRESRLVVETDGYRFHRGRIAFEDDRTRDIELKLLGYEVVRFTYRQVMENPARVARALRVLLTSPGLAT